MADFKSGATAMAISPIGMSKFTCCAMLPERLFIEIVAPGLYVVTVTTALCEFLWAVITSHMA